MRKRAFGLARKSTSSGQRRQQAQSTRRRSRYDPSDFPNNSSRTCAGSGNISDN